jgi:hypothetical protein
MARSFLETTIGSSYAARSRQHLLDGKARYRNVLDVSG